MTKVKEGDWGAYKQRYAREDVETDAGSTISVFVSALQYLGEVYRPARIEFTGAILVRDLPAVMKAAEIAITAFEAEWGKIKQ